MTTALATCKYEGVFRVGSFSSSGRLTRCLIFFPVFWEQQGLQTFGHKIQITRPHASQPAFEAHFANLIEEYNVVHAINLLGTKENEAILADSYGRHLHAARAVFGNDIGISHFDFHAAVRIGGHESVLQNLMFVDSLSGANSELILHFRQGA